ncbi:MAG: phenylalanine--tRNA ligase subunit beta [Patescibacteria group bacterium]
MNIPISYKTLARYIDGIPNPSDLENIFLAHICEVEGKEMRGEDTIFDLKITPDRGDLLSYRGIAREVAVHSGAKLLSQKSKVKSQKLDTVLHVSVADPKLCPRYIGRVVEGVDGRESPAWLREALEASGQRSINAIVDVTNFVMLETGQPMHAFDLGKLATDDKQQTTLFVRRAQEGETVTTLDDKEIKLTPEILVIADSARVLAIAGVKGGAYAGVGTEVSTIVLEAAVFDAVRVRKASRATGIMTDSSRRFEHHRAPEISRLAMDRATELLLEIFPDARAGEAVDEYPHPISPTHFDVSAEEIAGILGIKYSSDDLARDLDRLGFAHKQVESGAEQIVAPAERFDIGIGADIAEEIARIITYDNIPATPLASDGFTPVQNDTYDAMLRVRNTLAPLGFSEIFTYVFRKEGKVEVINPMAEGISFLRDNLSAGMREALVFNARNAPLLGVDEILMFEIGTVFFAPALPAEASAKAGEEEIRISLGVAVTKNMKQAKKEERERELLASARTALKSAFGTKLSWTENGNVCECLLPVSAPIQHSTFNIQYSTPAPYRPIFAYPFMLRDIAMWSDGKTTKDEIIAIIRAEGGELLVRDRLFDVFEKDSKTSYAFNLVFQSHDRTLSDVEVNEIMARITEKLSAKGLEVR